MRKPTYDETKEYYRRLRRTAFAHTRADMAELVGIPELRLTTIDARALAAWRQHWTERHPSGVGRWEWEEHARAFRRDPAAFTLALWHGEQLCGLAAGRASDRRASGGRAAVSIHYVQSAPSRFHPLKGMVGPITVAAAEKYGRLIGASYVRIVSPLEGALPVYLNTGFTVVRARGTIVSCEREIAP